jgi:D-alanyl-D-alanine carboxypeptidase/D-alanyl-D-alanine-endopeptidase (penicillin-binding protein 4)
MRRVIRRTLVGGLVVALAVAGYAAADAEDLVPGVLTLAPATTGGGAASGSSTGAVSGAAVGSGTTGWPATGPVAAVLAAPDASAPAPTAAVLARLLTAAMGRLGKGGSGAVIDVASGHLLYSRSATSPRTPASTTKLLTAAAALSALGPDATLTTKVVAGDRPDRIVLVGGGDIRLSSGVGSDTAVYGHAGLTTLAAETAATLRSAGTQQVSLGFDDSIFTGPSLSSRWMKSDLTTSQIGPITALGLAAKAAAPGAPAPPDPSLVAARVFATALTQQGITVTGAPTRTRATAGATELAAVQSATIEQLVDYTLTVSDNTEAEVLARLAARAGGHAGSFAGAVTQDIRVAAALGVPVTGVRLYDGSGLARADLIPALTLARLIAAAAGPAHPELRPLFAGLPIAGLTGTLEPRFVDAHTRAAAGLVRAKTGTLSGVSTLAGLTIDADGRLLAFAFMASRPTAKTPPARALLDQAATILTGCGCR